MFFFLAILPFKKQIPYPINSICKQCGEICRYEIIMAANTLTVFFIPLFKFSKRFYVKCSNCSALFELDKKVGTAIANGENIIICDENLKLLDENFCKIGTCPHCMSQINEDFEYCPKCGKKL